LTAAAKSASVTVGVNQNFVYHPAFARLVRAVGSGRLGRPIYVDCLATVPLRQLAARQFGHWMFAEPRNILLEQAVHPISQLNALAGPFGDLQTMAGTPVEIAPGVPFYDSITVALQSAILPATLRMAVGQDFPFWQVRVVCSDGVAVADILSNRFFTYERARWLEPVDLGLSGLTVAVGIARDSMLNLANFGLSMVGLRARSDGFFVSMKDSIAAFHRALDEGVAPLVDGRFGAEIVRVCETAAKAFSPPRASKRPKESGEYDIAVIGGTGFIGAHLVKLLTAEGKRVGVMARNVRNLGPTFLDDNVVVVKGDVRSERDVDRFIGSAPCIVGLAHGGGGRTYAEVRLGMVGGAETIARACLAHGVERFIHVGSIASLYLGADAGLITGATPPDPRSDARADYSRAKAECDRMLLALHRDQKLPVCIVRPGLVVGEGGTPFHSGLGFYNNDQHCLGWNRGRNPLPFVLVEDVARAIAAALHAPGVEGRTFNLVGDVRLTAREYIAELSAALARPLYFHPHSVTGIWVVELTKWGLKRAAGRQSPRISRRDLMSRGLEATFDCSDVKQALAWVPTADRQDFLARAVRVHARP
jgi:nucleoside-diphosphate-sugar epimerase/predicted dehydrogenase